MEELDVKTKKETSILEDLGFESVIEDIFKLILHNDHVNDMVTVIVALMSVCKLTTEEATSIMMEAHLSGKAIAKTGTQKEMIRMKENLKSFNLEVTVEL